MKVLSYRDRVEAAGGLVLAVAFDSPERVRAGLLSGVEDPWPVLIDREREAYRRWGLGRASRLALLRFDWMRGYARMLLRGETLARPGSDVLQLGGDFVIGADGTVAFAHAQQGFDDRPPAGLLVRKLEAAR
ncbi:MAG: hypothetical protein QOJ57_1075 [Thermoleophilaceae bacterium]|nr:hypothetical protein [Thermoleophilaceae bacterium]